MKVVKLCCLVIFFSSVHFAYCQTDTTRTSNLSFVVVSEKLQPVEGCVVELLKEQKLEKVFITDAKGMARFEKIPPGAYAFSITCVGYQQQITPIYHFPSDSITAKIVLQPLRTALKEVNITAQKPFIEQKQGKVILNIGSLVTNDGTTVLEVLEKSPGVTVDRNGGISLQGKIGVLVMIDGKPTYLSDADLNNLLSSMGSSQVGQIELITNPSAKYDANGTAGIINIITKKNKVKGFNGSFSTSYGQGVYPKNNNNLSLNFRNGRTNTFFTYNLNQGRYFTDLYALRKYYDSNGSLTAMLQQPSYFTGTFANNTIKTGLDYYINPKITIGVALGGTYIERNGTNTGQAIWLNPAGATDSTIATTNKTSSQFENGSLNVNGKYIISSSQDIAIDADWLRYNIQNNQDFNNILPGVDGYDEQSRGSIPTIINITSAKVDYTLKIGKNYSLESGGKLSYSSTDNIASYQDLENGQWVEDLSMSNHFIYNENIHAFYSDIEGKSGDFSMQAGLRYEFTKYNADQLGNAIQKDSAFSRNYGGLFPSGYSSYQADSSNAFTITVGRRIDRPPYQNLNPFYSIINKYTYETGNPFLLPQYSWELELSHQYKNLLTTTVSYSVITNYFSQLFLPYNNAGILLYSEGNVGHVYNLGVSEAVSASLYKWWSLTAQAVYNYKELAGFNGNVYTSYINQVNFSTTQQFSITPEYTAEISGNYTTRARNDIQELLYPTGQLSVGLSRPVIKKKGTLRFSARDILRTYVMEGLTQFPDATEYFKLRRDTRVFTLAFTYRFGKAYKSGKHSGGSAADEIDRVGSG